jgi:hypothetical protein
MPDSIKFCPECGKGPATSERSVEDRLDLLEKVVYEVLTNGMTEKQIADMTQELQKEAQSAKIPQGQQPGNAEPADDSLTGFEIQLKKIGHWLITPLQFKEK